MGVLTGLQGFQAGNVFGSHGHFATPPTTSGPSKKGMDSEGNEEQGRENGLTFAELNSTTC